MKSIFSVTDDDLYMFFMPIVAWSWKRIGVDPIIIYVSTEATTAVETSKFILAGNYCPENALIKEIKVKDKNQAATYSQVSRLFAGTLPDIDDKDVIMTADADMAVFGDYLLQGDIPLIQVFGDDLVDEAQFPMCYISMTKSSWKTVMKISSLYDMQAHLDILLQPIVCENMRGNYWAYDQETIYNNLVQSNLPILKHHRANHPTQFATRRADRDSWPATSPKNIIDAHLPRPGFLNDNFDKVFNLFEDIYPYDNIEWMKQYREEYIKLL